MAIPQVSLGPMLTGDLDGERRKALRRMRMVAGGLLVAAAAVYLATLNADGFLGFVNAGAEASMVGAIADWFAVVALFRHPLGIPIPHTALIPKKKNDLGRSLEDFVGENFLQEGVIRDRVLGAEPALKTGQWLAQEANARWVVLEAVDVLRIGLEKVRDQDVADIVQLALVPRLLEEPVSPIVGRLLAEIVEDGAHRQLVDMVLEEAHRWLAGNGATFYDVVAERAPWWAPEILNERVIGRLHTELLDWLSEIRQDADHRTRRALDQLLRDLADGLLTDENVMARMERLKERLLSHPQVAATTISLWNALRRAFMASLEDPDSEVVRRAVAEAGAFGERLVADVGLRSRIDERVAGVVVFFVERYGREATSVITHTIDQWDGQEAADRIELHVGKDLQFIRINGTIVGGLVGVLIHTVSVVLS